MMGMIWLYLCILCVLLFSLDVKNVVDAALSDDADMLNAARDGDLDKVLDFVNNKRVSLTTRNNYGVSAIIWAANNGHLPVVQALVKLGAKVDDRSNNLKTPLLWATFWGHFPVVQYLVDHGANISAQDREGLTPLMTATMKEHLPIVEYLLQKGANPSIKNYYNGTALSIAQSKQNKVLVELLKPHVPPAEEEPSPYKILWGIIQDKLWLWSQLVVSEICAVLGVQEIALDQYYTLMKEQVLELLRSKGSASTAETGVGNGSSSNVAMKANTAAEEF